MRPPTQPPTHPLRTADLYNYSQPVYRWLESFPVEQFHVIQ